MSGSFVVVLVAVFKGLASFAPAALNATEDVGDALTDRFDAGDDSTRWTFGTLDQVRSSPAVVEGVVFVGSDDGDVSAISAS